MTRTIELVTPSYAPDFALCVDLAASVRRFGPAGTAHRILVPKADRERFAPLANETTSVVDVREVLPRQLRRLPGANMWVNLRAPLPPVRGWIAQQLVKLAAVATSDADAVLVVDSDLEFIRPFSLADFEIDGALPLYRLDGAVTPELPRHMIWDDVARRLLGLPPTSAEQRPDYICWPCLWDPAVVREMLARVEAVTGRDWATAIGRELHFSEMVLYGVYVDEVVGGSTTVVHTSDTHCRVHPDEIVLDAAGFERFLGEIRPSDVAVMVSARSGTDPAVRSRALARYRIGASGA